MDEAYKYLAYYEVLEASGFVLSNDLDKLKDEWCFSMRIFDVGGLTQKILNEIPKPRYPKIKDKYEIIYSEGQPIHEK